MLVEQQKNYRRKFTALRFVYRDGVCPCQLIKLIGKVFHQFESVIKDVEFSVIWIGVGNDSEITVENTFVIVVLDLHDFIADGKFAFSVRDDALLSCRVKFCSQQFVYIDRAAGSPVHRSQNLYISRRIKAEFFRNTLCDEFPDHLQCLVRVILSDPEEIAVGVIVAQRHFSGVHPVGCFNDMAAG